MFTAFTNHKPLMGEMLKMSDPWAPCQQRQLVLISKFTTDIKHLAGKLIVLLIASPDHVLALWRLMLITLQWLQHKLPVKIYKHTGLPSYLVI